MHKSAIDLSVSMARQPVNDDLRLCRINEQPFILAYSNAKSISNYLPSTLSIFLPSLYRDSSPVPFDAPSMLIYAVLSRIDD